MARQFARRLTRRCWAWLSLVPLLVLGLLPAPSASQSVTDRIDALRSKALTDATAVDVARDKGMDTTPAQWGNWPNWNNWNNWANWANWANWGNWGNWPNGG